MNDGPKTSRMNSECDAENGPPRSTDGRDPSSLYLRSNRRASSVDILRGNGPSGGEERRAPLVGG